MRKEGLVLFWPREHGAYGQVSFPLVTSFAVAGPSAGGAFLTLAVLAGFLAHEPAAVLLGLRGPRGRQQLGAAARMRLVACLAAGAVAGSGAMWTTSPAVRWWIAVPAVPALLLALALLCRREKSWYSEAAASLAFSGAAVPVTMAAGASMDAALTVAIPFALFFVTTTLAVRVVILRVRGGGHPGAAAATRYATIAVAVGAGGLLALLTGAGIVSPSMLIASSPGLLTATVIALRPPLATRLRRVGWTILAVSALTVVLVVATA